MFKKLTISKNNSRGFTLVELLIYMALLSIFLLMLTQIFVQILDAKAESEATSNVEQDGRYILARLSYDINRASSVTTPSSLGTSGSALALVIGGITNTYSLSSGDLTLANNLGTNNLNSSETTISSITFRRIGNAGGKDTINIVFTINSKTQRTTGSETRTFQITAGLK